MSNDKETKRVESAARRQEEDGKTGPRADRAGFEHEAPNETLIEHVGRAARGNPTSAALVGAGLLWMALGGARTTARGAGAAGAVAADAAQSVASSARTTAKTVGDALSSTADDVQEAAARAGKTAADASGEAVRAADDVASKGARKASRKASRAEGYAERTAKRARSALSNAGEEVAGDLETGVTAVRRGGGRALKAAGDLAQDRPFLFSAIWLATGAGAATLLPRTRREDEWFGEYSGATVRAVRKQTASIVAGSVATARAKTSDAVQDAARKAAEEAAEQVLRQADNFGGVVAETFEKMGRNESAEKDE